VPRQTSCISVHSWGELADRAGGGTKCTWQESTQYASHGQIISLDILCGQKQPVNAPSSIDEIERLLLDVVKALYAQDTQVAGLLDLPIAQLRVLNVLGREASEHRPTMGEMAESLGVALSTATQIVERIEKRGLVQRAHGDPDDRRVVRLALTPQGRTLLNNRRRLRRERLARALDALDGEQRSALAQALLPLADAARALSEGAETGHARADLALPR